jgi:multicomponent Na+:H+ antiporter subunit B
MKRVSFILTLAVGALLIMGMEDLPNWGAADSPASLGISVTFITEALTKTGVPNLVTAVLADYRGYDTMFETAVIFAAGMAILLILRISGPRPFDPSETGIHFHTMPLLEDDLITQVCCRIMVPLMQLFALYVVIHGHHSPGGGFQGGVILGASFILKAICYDLDTAMVSLDAARNYILANTGVVIYAGWGALCLLFAGGNFLDYSALAPIFMGDAVAARYWSMLIVEIGVATTVAVVMFAIYADLASDGKLDEGI